MIALFGGIGLFLLGMVLLTDGLKSFAGDSLRLALLRFTGKPVTAFTSGALVTALVQSSSATTLTTIGFVSAGLLSFSQAVGLVMGASLGTTSTGWLVSVFGLKFSITQFALPMIGVGAFMRLLGRGRTPSLGMALAGFGLIFVGIDQLQVGMAGLTEHIDLEAIPSRGLWGHLLMMLIGIVLTVLMQSSSAAVATTLAALHTGAVTFEQSASLVIGAAVGTTVTAALAAIGASTSAKRTALAHILFNLFTGLIAIVCLPFFLRLIIWSQAHLGLDPGAVSLAAFHTAFITLGVLVFLPFVGPFSHMIERLLPEKGPQLTRHLDLSLLTVPPVAMEASRMSLRESAALVFGILHQRLTGVPVDRDMEIQAEQVELALREVSDFITKIPPVEHEKPGHYVRRDSFHAIDHMGQLLPCVLQRHTVTYTPILAAAYDPCITILDTAAGFLSAGRDKRREEDDVVGRIAAMSQSIAQWRKAERARLLETSSQGGASADQSLQLLDTIRWIDQIAYHAWRITHYLSPDGASVESPDRVNYD